jgi:predicted phosphodiesterase
MNLTKPFPRLWSLEAGIVMVVTDLHGDWEAYQRYRDRFISLHAGGQADYLVLTGDLIHREQVEAPDHSLEMVLDVLALQAAYGEAVICLLGNHELPHIYGISLAKGNRDYTPTFEATLTHSRRRAEITALFDSLPFYLCTRAGVTITHAGAAHPLTLSKNAQILFNWDHQTMLNRAEAVMATNDIESWRRGYARLNGISYEAMARYFLAVSGPDDPRYNDLLRGFLVSNEVDFQEVLWPALFTRCEQDYGPADYAIFLDALLHQVKVGSYRQRALVAGHITMHGGYRLVAQHHLRLASGHHATPSEAACYLLFDAAQPIHKAEELLTGLASVYR